MKVMDAKALAKSKRAHSQHHSKKLHPSQKHKLPSAVSKDADANAKKQAGKPIGEKTRQVHRALPSNWDRYEEEFDSESEERSGEVANPAPDVIVPKSKGADFRHLISEAQSQLQSNPYSDTPSLDDFLSGDFNQFVGSMLSVRGEGILSWIGSDNFVVEDKTAATPEASFLSLNLHALAEQLEKVDLSKRLYIEEDLLPPELRGGRANVNSIQGSHQMQTTCEEKAEAQITEEPTLNDFPERVKIACKNFEHIAFGSGIKSEDASLSNGELDLVDEVSNNYISGKHDEYGKRRAQYSSTQDISNKTSVSNKITPKFEAAAAETELDMLLNSFGDSKLLDSSGSKSKNISSDFHREGSPSLPHLVRKGFGSDKSTAVTSSVDDLLDDLLQETSTMVNQGFNSSKSAAVTSSLDDALDDLLRQTSTVVNKSVSSSKSAAVASNFDDLLDDLLEETSMMVKPK